MLAYTRKHELLYWQYSIYIIAEIAAMSLFFTLFAKFFPRTEIEPRDILDIFEQSAKNTAWVLLLPYSISWLYFSWREKSKNFKNSITFCICRTPNVNCTTVSKLARSSLQIRSVIKHLALNSIEKRAVNVLEFTSYWTNNLRADGLGQWKPVVSSCHHDKAGSTNRRANI